MRKWMLGACALAMISTGGAAFADEAWNSTFGRVEWETQVGETVVFSYTAPSGAGTARVFIEDALTTMMASERSSYSGYWIEYDQQEVCEASLTDPLGGQSQNWGRFEITFVRDGFPSDWTAHWGYCLAEPDQVWVGHALLGDEEAYPPPQ